MGRTMFLAMALFGAMTGEARSNYYNGNDLWAWCEQWTAPKLVAGQNDFYQAGLCQGFIGGVVDAFVDSKTLFCVPQGERGVRAGQLVEIVKIYLRNHPETRHLLAVDLVANALIEKFPCR